MNPTVVGVVVKILIVEDNEDSRRLLALNFSREGYSVVAAEDGAEGLAKVLEEKPGVVVTGLQLRRVHGIEMIKQLRKRPEMKSLKIIVLTAHDGDHANAAREAGADIVLHKPLAFDSLNDIVKRIAIK